MADSLPANVGEVVTVVSSVFVGLAVCVKWLDVRQKGFREEFRKETEEQFRSLNGKVDRYESGIRRARGHIIRAISALAAGNQTMVNDELEAAVGALE